MEKGVYCWAYRSMGVLFSFYLLKVVAAVEKG
jgi:hypothetical protein